MGGPSKQDETSEERALADVSRQALDRQHETYDPIVNRYIARANDGKTPVSQARALSTAATESAFAPATSRAVASGFARGAGPGSAIRDMSLGKTESRALGGVNANMAGRNLQLSRLGQIISYGRGQATQAVTGLGETGQAAQEQSIRDAMLAAGSREAIGSVVGAGAGLYYGMRKPTGPNTASSDNSVVTSNYGEP